MQSDREEKEDMRADINTVVKELKFEMPKGMVYCPSKRGFRCIHEDERPKFFTVRSGVIKKGTPVDTEAEHQFTRAKQFLRNRSQGFEDDDETVEI